MGLSNAISGGIVMITMVAIVLTLPLLLDTTLSIHDSTIESNSIEKNQFKMILNMTNIDPIANSNNNEIQFDLTILSGDGTNKFWNFEKSDLIITFDEETPQKLTESQTYGGLCGGLDPPQGTWCIDSFSNDNMDPQILNIGETMTIRTTVSGNLDGGTPGDAIIALSTDIGVVATGSAIITP